MFDYYDSTQTFAGPSVFRRPKTSLPFVAPSNPIAFYCLCSMQNTDASSTMSSDKTSSTEGNRIGSAGRPEMRQSAPEWRYVVASVDSWSDVFVSFVFVSVCSEIPKMSQQRRNQQMMR